MIDWGKFLISAVAGYVGLSLLKPKLFHANQGFFGFSLPLSIDVPITNCTPAGYGGLATYCDRSGYECGQGPDCNSALVNYCQRYGRGPGGTCLSGPNGLSGPPLTSTPFPSGYGAAPGGGGYGYGGYPQQGYGYGYPQQPSYGYGYNPYQTPQYPTYGYGYPQGYGYNPTPPYYYNPYQTRRAYAVTGYDKKSGHFLYGF